MGIYSKLQKLAVVLAAAVSFPSLAGTPTPGLYEPKVELPGRYQDHLLSTQEVTPPKLRQRIWNGSYVPQGKYPWMAFLLIDGRSQCGASLIGAQWAITAAHCTAGGNEFTLAIGRANLEDSDSGVVIRASAFNHPQYNNGAAYLGYDIALLKLEVPIPTSYISEYAQLATASLTNSYAGTGDRVQVAGYGQDERGQTSNILRENVGNIESSQNCGSSWGQGYDQNLQICMEASNNTVCKGDSGGPLFFNIRGDDVVAGLVSYGSSQGCNRAPAVFTRVSYFLPWVQNTIAANTDSDNDDNTGDDDDNDSGIVEVSNGASGQISVTEGETNLYQIDVPAGATLTVNTSGNSGDADLFVNFGSLPNTNNAGSNDCASTSNNSTERCVVSESRAGTYYVAVYAYRSFSNVSLSFNYETEQDNGDDSDNGGNDDDSGAGADFEEVYEDLAGSSRNWKNGSFEIPQGATNVTFYLQQGTGTAGLFVRRGSSSLRNTRYRCEQLSNGDSACVISAPQAGTYYVGIYGYTAYSGATFILSYDN